MTRSNVRLLFTLSQRRFVGSGKGWERTMKTRTAFGRTACGLGATLLAASACATLGVRSASAAANQPGTTQPAGQTVPQTSLIKQNDLAATSLLISVALGEPTPDRRVNLVPVFIGTCRNLGTLTYKPGFRALRLHHTVDGVDHVVAASFIPQLGPGKTFSISYHLPENEEGGYDYDGYSLEVSQGSLSDENPGNDVYELEIASNPNSYPAPTGNRN